MTCTQYVIFSSPEGGKAWEQGYDIVPQKTKFTTFNLVYLDQLGQTYHDSYSVISPPPEAIVTLMWENPITYLSCTIR